MKKETPAEIIARVYGDTSPVRIPCPKHCKILWGHPDFEPLAEPECEFDSDMQPTTPGIIGYLRGVPVYYSPLK